MFDYKKFSLPMIFTTFFSYSTNKTELPCANSKYSQCLNCFSYLLPAVDTICSCIEAVDKLRPGLRPLRPGWKPLKPGWRPPKAWLKAPEA